MIKKLLATCLLAFTGMLTASGQKNYEDVDVKGFAALATDSDVIVVDVRTTEEYAEGHIEGALNIDVRQDDFTKKAKAALPVGKRIAVYCRSGRRSANASNQLAAEGYQCFNLVGGIMAWETAGMPMTAEKH